MVISGASSRCLQIESGDLDHGYLQGEKLSKPLVLRQPTGGFPDKGIKSDDRMFAFVPIYGTRDAGRGLSRHIRKVLVGDGFTENFIMSALYSYSRCGVVLILFAAHVDDIIWACDPEVDKVMTSVMKLLAFGTLDVGSFRCCGIEIVQDVDFTIQGSCEQTSQTRARTPRSRTKQAAGRCGYHRGA